MVDDKFSTAHFGDDVNEETFGQILEMDEDEDHDFSKDLVLDFFQQAKTTFSEMDEMLKEGDLPGLSERGHYLKGSSATLGLNKLQQSCEEIQRYGKMEEIDGLKTKDSEEKMLKRVKESVKQAKSQCKTVEIKLKKYYDMPAEEEKEEDEEEEEKEEEEEEEEKEKRNKEDKEETQKETADEEEKKEDAKADLKDDKATKTEA